MRRDTRNSVGNSTARGSGHHHRIGWPREYQGKMPRRYAASRRGGDRSPPAASRPSGSRSARSTGGNASGESRSESQTIEPRMAPVSQASARLLLEGNVLLHLPDVFVLCRMLLLQVAVDRAPEARIRDPVRRPGLRRLEAARYLVLALRAGLEALQTLLDTVLDSLVIARLEMQAVKLRRGAPVTAVKRAAAAKENRSRDRRAFQ